MARTFTNKANANLMILRDYQNDIANRGLSILQAHHILYLSMQVRTGKTLTALRIADLYGATSVLFLTKKKAIGSISNDDEDAEGDFQKLAPGYEIGVTNYEQAHKLRPEDYDLIILDEAHCLGQYPTPAKRVKLLRELCKDKPIIYLSGTPSPESYSQLYHQFWVSSFSPFAGHATFYKWAADFVTIKKKYFFNRQINDYSCADKAIIDELTSHLFISFTQEQAGFVQHIQEEVIEIPMREGTYAIADYLRKHRIYIGRGGEEILADTEVKLMNKLHQIYTGTIICEDGNGIVFDNSKAVYIRDNFRNQKVGIFYKFKAERIMLISVFGIDRITESPEEFNVRDDKIFISQVQSGREGTNLSTADCLIMMNIDFSAVSYWQARARLQAKDRVKECKVYWLFSVGGIEGRVYERVKEKKDYTLSYFKRDYDRVGVKKQLQKTTY